MYAALGRLSAAKRRWNVDAESVLKSEKRLVTQGVFLFCRLRCGDTAATWPARICHQFRLSMMVTDPAGAGGSSVTNCRLPFPVLLVTRQSPWSTLAVTTVTVL